MVCEIAKNKKKRKKKQNSTAQRKTILCSQYTLSNLKMLYENT